MSIFCRAEYIRARGPEVARAAHSVTQAAAQTVRDGAQAAGLQQCMSPPSDAQLNPFGLYSVEGA
eukprot:6656115-Pyramimonas_sp.AAC.1